MKPCTLHVLDSDSYAERAVAGLHGARLSCMLHNVYCIQQQLAIDTVYIPSRSYVQPHPLRGARGLDHMFRDPVLYGCV